MKKDIKHRFQAVFNPFNRQLSVLFGDAVVNYTFEEIEEWVKISFNGDDKNPYYLHVQLDYDESLQLLFYPRKDGNQSLNEGLGTYFDSNLIKDIPNAIKIAYNDKSFLMFKSELLIKSNKKEITI